MPLRWVLGLAVATTVASACVADVRLPWMSVVVDGKELGGAQLVNYCWSSTFASTCSDGDRSDPPIYIVRSSQPVGVQVHTKPGIRELHVGVTAINPRDVPQNASTPPGPVDSAYAGVLALEEGTHYISVIARWERGKAYFLFALRVEPEVSPTAVTSPSATSSGTLVLSGDRKSVVVDGQVVLAIDNDQIVEWFRTQSQLCDPPNISATPDRRAFCTDKAAFKSRTQFASVVSSPDGTKIGFTIGSETLVPDTVAGIYLRSTGTVRFLTTYYLGNQFISFSPSGANFVYQGGCFEANCGLFLRDTVTLVEKARVNDLVGGERHQNATFVRWISENEVEYRLGPELKRASF